MNKKMLFLLFLFRVKKPMPNMMILYMLRFITQRVLTKDKY